MAVKLRLMRMGKKKQPTYRVVAADSRSPRNGRFIEIVGTYEPREDPSRIVIDNDKAVAWLRKGAQPTDRVLDLFCGLGNFTLPIGRRVAEVVGVEGEHGLVERAAENAARNGIANARFEVANLFEDQRHAHWAKQSWDKLLLDPPRAGADKVLDYLPHKETQRIVYVSCHPGSLARDAGILVQKHGFRLSAAGVMDMFPHTAHVESIALFER